jgi:hypothetical protein
MPPEPVVFGGHSGRNKVWSKLVRCQHGPAGACPRACLVKNFTVAVHHDGGSALRGIEQPGRQRAKPHPHRKREQKADRG